MIRYDGDVVYSESGSGIKATSRILFNEAQVTAIKAIARDEFSKRSDYGIVYVVKDMKLDDYGKLELIHVFEDLHDAQKYATGHPRAVIIPRGTKAWPSQKVKVKTADAKSDSGERIIKLNVRERMTNKVKEAFGGLISVVVLIFCACICGLILGGLILANIFLWHWIISML